jgi:hypothetical protein
MPTKFALLLSWYLFCFINSVNGYFSYCMSYYSS